MNVHAHLAVRRLYVQLRRAEQLQRHHSDDGAAAAEEPEPQPPEPTSAHNPFHSSTAAAPARASVTPSTSPLVAASAPPARSRGRWLRQGDGSALNKATPSASTARAESTRSASRVSRFMSWVPGRRHTRGQLSSSAARAGGGCAEAQGVSEVRQWKLRLAATLRDHCTVVETCLRGMLTEHVGKSLAAAAACVEASQATSPNRTDCTSSSPVFVRALSTGYAVTLSMEAATHTTAPSTAAAKDAALKVQHAEHTASRERPSLTSQINPLVPPPQGGVSTVHIDDDDDPQRVSEGDATRHRRRSPPAPRATAEAAPDPRGAPATRSEKATSRVQAAPHRTATVAPTPATRSLCEQLDACPTNASLPWCTAGTPANPLSPTSVAAVCAGLHALQSRATQPSDGCSAGAGGITGGGAGTHCTLWEYVPLCSSLHATCASDGAKGAARTGTAPHGPTAATTESKTQSPPAAAPPPPLPGPAMRETASDPLALTGDCDWHTRQASLRSVQAWTAHLALAGDSSTAPALMASTLTPVRSLAALGAARAVVEVHYSATPSELQAVSWSLSAPHNRGGGAEEPPRVTLHATWTLCVEVDAVHAPWLLQALLGVASTATPRMTCDNIASAVGLQGAVRTALRSLAGVDV